MKNKVIANGLNLHTSSLGQEEVSFVDLFGTLANANLTQAQRVILPKGNNKYRNLYNYNPLWNSSFFRVSEDVVNRTVAVLLLPVAAVLSVIPLTTSYFGKPYFINDNNLLFMQKRVGYQGKEFKIFKIKTLFHDGYWEYNRFPWVRFLGLDELPQLWNVIKGDMALWGGRPLMKRDLRTNQELSDKYLDYMNHRKPGMMSRESLRLRMVKLFPKRSHSRPSFIFSRF